MATTTKPVLEVTPPCAGAGVPAWPREQSASGYSNYPAQDLTKQDSTKLASSQPSQRDALQALLAFSALHDQVRRRRALAARSHSFDAGAPVAKFEPPEFEPDEQFVLDEVLQLVAERAVAITGADGLAIALAENNEIVLRAAAGAVRPDVGARIDRDSAFSGACFRTAQVVNCDDTETDPRVNVQACRKLAARSMVAVPLCGRRRVIGVLEAFSSWPFGFNDSDIRNLSLLAELVLAALKPEDEDRFAESAQAAAGKLEAPSVPAKTPAAIAAPKVARVSAEVPVVPVVDKKVADKKADHKPVAVKVDSAPIAAVLGKTATEKIFKVETKVAAAGAAQIRTVVAEPQANSRPMATILLVCIVIAAAFAGGVWWKLKTAQLSGAMIQTENIPTDEMAQLPTQLATRFPMPASRAILPPLRKSCRSFRESPAFATGHPATPAPWCSIWKTRCNMRRTAWPVRTASISICTIRSSLPT
jgi:putative methionine-R-sulfoxide reductase with GAF domain